MSILNTGRHRGMSVSDLKQRISDLEKKVKAADQSECEHTRLTLHFNELGEAYQLVVDELAAEREAKVKAQEDARLFDAERQKAKAEAQQRAEEAERLATENRSLKQQLRARDTSAIEDQATVPTDLRQLREAVRKGEASAIIRIDPVRPKPLPQAPFAMEAIPTSPTATDNETTQTHLVILPAAS